MKKTFTTVMPDRIGAFLEANRLVSGLGLNITRVSYNKAVDVHMLFIEVEGEEEQLILAERQLRELGYLREDRYRGSVLLVEFSLKDEPGTLSPVLELIRQYELNISFISSCTDGSGYQAFKMGLFVENGREVSQFMHEAALLCPVRVIDYNPNERILDNTVFYITFAGEISEKLSLDDDQKRSLIVQSNAIMQMLDERNGTPSKTFEYIRLFADYLARARHDGYRPRISRLRTESGLDILNLEPPCGSNTTVIFCGGRLLCVDSGFRLYHREWKEVLEREIPGFDGMKKDLVLSHGDVDHAGCADEFDRVYASGTCCVNFIRENSGMAAIREDNPIHAPYVVISKILSDYIPPDADSFTVIGESTAVSDIDGSMPLRYAGNFSYPEGAPVLDFEIYEGAGGHVRGEIVLVERKHRIAFTGDIYVNVKNTIQTDFNRLAPYLMTSVDTDAALAKAERSALAAVLGEGKWTVFGGHGAMMELVL